MDVVDRLWCVKLAARGRRQEAEIHYSMRHPNIVEVIAFALGDKQRPPCMVMERMHETMYDVLAVEGIAITTLAAVSIIRDVCEVWCAGVWFVPCMLV